MTLNNLSWRNGHPTRVSREPVNISLGWQWSLLNLYVNTATTRYFPWPRSQINRYRVIIKRLMWRERLDNFIDALYEQMVPLRNQLQFILIALGWLNIEQNKWTMGPRFCRGKRALKNSVLTGVLPKDFLSMKAFFSYIVEIQKNAFSYSAYLFSGKKLGELCKGGLPHLIFNVQKKDITRKHLICSLII